MQDARIVETIPLKSGKAERSLAVSGADRLVFTVHPDAVGDPMPDQVFRRADAVEVARRVLAGEERTVTGPGSIRLLAAAVLFSEHELEGGAL